MNKQLFLLLTCLLSCTLSHAQQQAPPQPALPQQPSTTAQFSAAGTGSNSNFTYNIIDTPNSTFCYDVYADGWLMIHQSSMPGLPGNEGFKTKDDAMKVAEMVIYKIRKGEMPPTVSIEEIKRLGVIE